MIRRLVGSRAFVSIGAAMLAVVVLAVGAVVIVDPFKERLSYCAIMPDAIGLHVGSDVTIRGVPVGRISGVTPETGSVNVTFEVDAEHALYGEVGATTVADSIAADRRLEVVGGKGDEWIPSRCITKASTPKSISQTLSALSKLADDLDGGSDPQRAGALSSAIREIDQATRGTGPTLAAVVERLASALREPDATLADLGSLIDNIATLSRAVGTKWGDLRRMLSGLQPILELVNHVWGQVVLLVDSIVVILPWINDITRKYGSDILGLLEQTVPHLDLIAANVGTIEALIDMVPIVGRSFRQVPDPRTGRLKLAYAPPKVRLEQGNASATCAAINSLMPDRCNATAGGASTDLTAVVLGVIGLGNGRN